ncbi:winged helix DNA-binding domain-containing protein [Paenibacillus sp. UNC451MF]|uniref:winged helix DNA-binding domain-containing protein n=1 Tax=Paenibacillus sp. UNC451MF TaxID=1449063 RepID=UPI0005658F1F|nr:winged helix DNA-binding domain-containing protein [Paenibacillus sp. UNC451MF]
MNAKRTIIQESVRHDNVLGPRALNRALLARQFLIERTRLPVGEVLEHLIGLQSQAPNPPYFGLWTRLKDFTQESLSQLLLNRQAVRIALMRSTIFLVTSRDCLTLRPLVQPVLDRGLKGNYGKYLNGIDLHAAGAYGRRLVEEKPLTFSEMGQLLQEQWPDCDPSALSAVVRTLVPLVQTPPRGIWGSSGQAVHTSAVSWIGSPLASEGTLESLVTRYLRAFGPASISDVQVWSGLTQLRKVMERLRPHLCTFVDDNGIELFDVPGGERPDVDTPVPVRFLAEFDNMLLSYKDRTRIIADDYRKRVFTVNGIIKATILIDGFVQGLWRIKCKGSTATLIIEPFQLISQSVKDELTVEGERLLLFAEPDATVRDIQFVAGDPT